MNVDKSPMRDYLLGTLEPDRQTQLEERILCEPGVYEELLVVEQELIDQYVAGGLSKLEQQQFESHFLITPERQKNVRFGKLLKRYVTSHPILPDDYVPAAVRHVEKTAPAKKSFPFYLAPFRRSPALALSAAFIACLGIVLFCWLALRKSAEGPPRQGASGLMVVTLAPGSMRSSGTTQRVTVPPTGVDIKLELELTNTSFHNYKSQLFRESEAVDTRDKLKMEAKGDHHIVPLTITGELLSPGDYQVRLSGVLDSGEDEFIDNYSFRVTTE